MLILSFFVSNCAPQNTAANENKNELIPEKNDDGEWELHVLDSQYEYFLNAIAKPMSMYSESTLKSRNAILVSEWNSMYMTGRHRNVIESSVEYDPRENYGLKFEYRLYQVFAYVQWKYGVRLNGLSQADVR